MALTRTNLLLETEKVRRLRKTLRSRSNSEAVRLAIDDRLAAEGFRLRIVHQQPGLFTTTGRALRSGAAAPRDAFIVVSEEPGRPGA